MNKNKSVQIVDSIFTVCSNIFSRPLYKNTQFLFKMQEKNEKTYEVFSSSYTYSF